MVTTCLVSADPSQFVNLKRRNQLQIKPKQRLNLYQDCNKLRQEVHQRLLNPSVEQQQPVRILEQLQQPVRTLFRTAWQAICKLGPELQQQGL